MSQMPPSFGRTIPFLRIFDVPKTREFYVGYLGFSVDFEHRFHDNAPLFMQVSRRKALSKRSHDLLTSIFLLAIR